MFRKAEFSRLLLAAKGKRSMRKYALLADVSPAHLSRLSRGLLDTPPTPETLRKLASVADNSVTLKDFMDASGHFDEPDEVKEDRQGEVIQTIFMAGKGWSVKKGKDVDYILENENGEKWEWIEGGTLEDVYGRLAMLNKGEKRSIVVRNSIEKNKFLKNPPKSLDGDYSLVFLKERSWEEIPLVGK